MASFHNAYARICSPWHWDRPQPTVWLSSCSFCPMPPRYVQGVVIRTASKQYSYARHLLLQYASLKLAGLPGWFLHHRPKGRSVMVQSLKNRKMRQLHFDQTKHCGLCKTQCTERRTHIWSRKQSSRYHLQATKPL